MILFQIASGEAAFERQNAVVEKVLTGDQVQLNGGKILQYTGVQAPPLQSKIILVREYGQNSLAFNKELVEGKEIMIEWDSQIRNEYGRLLGYVFLKDGTFVNDRVLKSGHARPKAIPPNLRYAGLFRKSALEAERAKLGLWAKEANNPFIKSDYIGEKNSKIFYFPTSPELERIPESYLVHFRSRIEAIAAGYKPCATCREDQNDPFL